MKRLIHNLRIFFKAWKKKYIVDKDPYDLPTINAEDITNRKDLFI